jgi:amino acid adenylation domain-containing protein
LACLKAGRIFVPLDLNNPPARQALILRDAGVDLILADGTDAAPCPRTPALAIDQAMPGGRRETLDRRVRADDIAFLLYTSGSTGIPKGVINTHAAVVSRIADHNRFDVGPGDRLSAFGPGGMTLFRALLTGATLVSLDFRETPIDTLGNWLVEQRITLYHSVPTVFRHFVSTLTERLHAPDLRLVNLTGETVLSRDVSLFRRWLPEHCVLVNGLGTTETGTFREQRIADTTAIEDGVLPVGHAVEDMAVLILDEQNRAVGPRQAGEIVVAGDHISPGYWQRPELTAARFIRRCTSTGTRAYRTGDIGHLLPDGTLVHLGRRDFQIKVRGNRVEVGEVELALLDQPGIGQAAVVGRRGDGGGTRLEGYIVPEPGSRPDPLAVTGALRRRLPEHMVPARLIVLPELPLTPNGKVDRQALVPPDGGGESVRQPAAAPADETEQIVLSIWKQVFAVEHLATDDNFFGLGGDSLSALRILTRVVERLDVELPVSALFDNPTVATLSNAVARQRRSQR